MGAVQSHIHVPQFCTSLLGSLQQLGAILRGNGLYLFQKFNHLLPGEPGRRSCARRHGHADFEEEFIVPGWRTDADHSDWFEGCVVELVRSVGRNIDRVSRTQSGLLAPECYLHLTVEEDEGLFELVTMWRWPAPLAARACRSHRIDRWCPFR